VRIYELARELGIESKEVLAHAQELDLDVKTASSGVDDEAAELLRLSFAPEEPKTEEPKVEAAAPDDQIGAEEEAIEDMIEELEEEHAAGEVQIASVPAGVSVGDFADAISQQSADVVGELLKSGIPAGVNDVMPADLIEEIAETFGYIVEVQAAEPEPVVAEQPQFDDAEADLTGRPPVVTVMGHVDHGKTTLLDTIRKAHVVDDEQGGITQHIGAYQVEVHGHPVTFIDTPGHEAFTALRARGANITDIVVLVVAADDGVMPQTIEAISHAKAAGVKTIVAVNKIDVAGADALRVRTELTEHGVLTEELGGDVPSVEVSALKGEGVTELLEVIDLIAQLEDFKANSKPKASGVVVEAQLETGRGPVASVIVQRGTLKKGDAFVAGAASGRARALMDENGEQLKSAGPSDPVQIMGWDDVPAAGDYSEDGEPGDVVCARPPAKPP
jgi:translation initiation factor IF-2